MKFTTERLIIRKPQKEDWRDILEGAGDIEIARQTLLIPHPYGEADATDFICHVRDLWKEEEKSEYTFFIEHKKLKKVIGVTGLFFIDNHNRLAKTGSWMNRKYQRNGFMTEAKITVLSFAFNDLNLRRLETEVYAENVASNGMVKKLGFTLEGLQRKKNLCLATGEMHDTKLYGILKEEWEAHLPKLKEYLKNKIQSLK